VGGQKPSKNYSKEYEYIYVQMAKTGSSGQFIKSIIKLIPLEGKASPDEYRCTHIPPGALNQAFDLIYLTKIQMHPAVH
jgi:hypothetical protein